MDTSAEQAAAVITARLDGHKPRAGLVLGSGMDRLAEAIDESATIPYDALPGFPAATVDGHAGHLVLGSLGGTTVACMRGRAHLYEGHDPATLTLPIRALRLAECDILVLTNAAGSLDPALEPGSLMALSDHINLLGRNPLVGPNDDRFGPRFFDMTEAYDADLRARLRAAAQHTDVVLREGVYIAVLGPNFETPAEIRAFRALGADAVGMSTVPECLAARHCGMRVAAISAITNLAAGLTDDTLSHEHTLAVAARAAGDMERLLIAFFAALGGGSPAP